jgi:hypothetical protein
MTTNANSINLNLIGIQRIIDRFDFEKVHDYMKSVNWRWGLGELHVPEISEMKKAAEELLMMAVESNIVKHEEGTLRLAFIITECEDSDV